MSDVIVSSSRARMRLACDAEAPAKVRWAGSYTCRWRGSKSLNRVVSNNLYGFGMCLSASLAVWRSSRLRKVT
jgi:hypothetical protein